MHAQIEDSPQEGLIRAELAQLGLRWLGKLSCNQSQAALCQAALSAGEGRLSDQGALVVETGSHTGRSPKDKFIVCDDATSDRIWWDNNQVMSKQHFDMLTADMLIHARMKNLYVQDLEACADSAHKMPTRVITELAWHALFISHLLAPPPRDKKFTPTLTIINLPSFKANPKIHGTNSSTVIAFDLSRNLVLIGGTEYAGEIKKAVFTVLNDKLPTQGVLPMHCSINLGKNGEATVFFGLSGTGKTTLSADPTRSLIGDDEHGWGENGVFNIENGCYAKAINLGVADEPEIYKAATQFLTVLENVKIDDESREVDFTDVSKTENTRAAYSLSAIANASATRTGPAPRTIIMLTADAFGVLPPIALLNSKQAIEQFLCGYTAKLAGTERGVKKPEATFSACFGAPFLPRHPQIYAEMLQALIAKHECRCILLNTGWIGGAYGEGKRIPLAVTRKLLEVALTGELDHAPTRQDANFGFAVPLQVDGIANQILDPRASWHDKQAYDQAAHALAASFKTVLQRFENKPVIHMLAAE